jgi:N-carbamoyl-L-amino-acid hydrolase
VELRLNDKFGMEPTLGHQVWDWQESLARYSDPGYVEKGQLTVTYLTEAHRAAAPADRLHHGAVRLRRSGDRRGLGNVVGRLPGCAAPDARWLAHRLALRPRCATPASTTARLGIFSLDGLCRPSLRARRRRLPFGIEVVVAFAEEEGQRYNAALPRLRGA